MSPRQRRWFSWLECLPKTLKCLNVLVLLKNLDQINTGIAALPGPQVRWVTF